MTACICRPRDPEGWYREDCPTHGREAEDIVSERCALAHCIYCGNRLFARFDSESSCEAVVCDGMRGCGAEWEPDGELRVRGRQPVAPPESVTAPAGLRE